MPGPRARSARPPRTAGGDADLAAIGILVADQARCRMLYALANGQALPASRLAAEAEVSAATASSHLRKLTDGGLLAVEPNGRYRNYRIAGPEVADLIEALERLAPALPIRSLSQDQRSRAWKEARACYDHLAGRLAVELMHVLLDWGAIEPIDQGGDAIPGQLSYVITKSGSRVFDELGLQIPTSRQPVRYHTESTDGAAHLSGALGRALLVRFIELRWIERSGGRAILVTPLGRQELQKRFGIPLGERAG